MCEIQKEKKQERKKNKRREIGISNASRKALPTGRIDTLTLTVRT